MKKLALDCDFYGRAIRHIIASLAPTLEVKLIYSESAIFFSNFVAFSENLDLKFKVILKIVFKSLIGNENDKFQFYD